jgi:hypothetical protein
MPPVWWKFTRLAERQTQISKTALQIDHKAANYCLNLFNSIVKVPFFLPDR